VTGVNPQNDLNHIENVHPVIGKMTYKWQKTRLIQAIDIQLASRGKRHGRNAVNSHFRFGNQQTGSTT